MSGLDGLQLDADGHLDMSQFPDDGTDLAGPELDQLREALHSDPVEEPTDQQWEAMFDDVMAADDSGPFALDEVDGLVPDGDGDPFDTSTTDGEAVVDAGEDATADADDVDGFDADADVDAGLDLDAPADDLDLDLDLDGGLDLATDDTVDDAFSPDVLDDAPADIANNDFEDLL